MVVVPASHLVSSLVTCAVAALSCRRRHCHPVAAVVVGIVVVGAGTSAGSRGLGGGCLCRWVQWSRQW